MAQKWTIITINPSRREVTMRNASGKTMIVPMGENFKDLGEQTRLVNEAQENRAKQDKRELLKRIALGVVILILIAVSIARR